MAATSERLIAKRETELTDEERKLVNSWGSEAFGPQEWIRTFSWSTPDWRLFLFDNGLPVSHVKLTIRRGHLGSAETLFAGVGGVMTPRAHQRKGFSSRLLNTAKEFIFQNVGADYGLLFCLHELTHSYDRLGWILVESPVYVEQPQGKIIWPKAAMVLPQAGITWHDAEIDVCGKPW